MTIEAHQTLLSAGDMSGDLGSEAWPVGDSIAVAIQFIAASATHVGTASIEVSPDGSNWSTATLRDGSAAEQSVSSGAAVNANLEVETACRYVRAAYSASSGAGSLTATASKKFQGAR